MRIGDLNLGAARLHDALKSLELAWAEAQAKWDDASRRNFEENHIRPILPALRTTLDAIGRLSDVFARAQRDCEDN